MAEVRPFESARSLHSPSRRLAALFGVLVLLGAPIARAAGPGAWTSAQDWSQANGAHQVGKQAVHMALLRGDNSPYHSRLLFWDTEQSGTLAGGEWGWTPNSDGCASFGNFTALQLDTSGVDIFCAGMTPLADGRLFIPGGTSPETGQYGENNSRIYTPGTGTSAGTWSIPPLMNEYRWYPSATTLEDGRAIVLSGSRHPNHRVFGGRTSLSSPPASPSADSVRRFAPIEDGAWEPAVVPALEQYTSAAPAIRERHTAVEMLETFRGEVVFGGLDADSTRLNDTYILRRYDNVTGADYNYKWEAINPITSLPAARSEHTAVSATSRAEMIMYGGLPSNGPSADVYRFVVNSGQYSWISMDVDGSAPAARYGHASCFEEINLPVDTVHTTRRMLMFGGRTSTGGAPTDSSLWALTFDPDDPNHATWSDITPATGSRPSARANCTLIADPLLRQHPGDYKAGHVAYLFGGWLGGTNYSNELWLLWTFIDGTTVWEQRSFSGVPSARARHAATFDGKEGAGNQYQRGRLNIFGGENASGIVDKHVYVVDPFRVGTPAWEAWAEADVALTGHTMTKEHLYEVTLARLPEVYSPGTDSWQGEPNSKLLQDPYPPTFVAPHSTGSGTRIVSMALDSTAYWLDLPISGAADSAWHPFPNGKLDYFVPTQAVMYRPGKIMVAGGEVDSAISQNKKIAVVAPGTTRTLDLSNTNNSWQSSASMQRRSFHNLVLLPSGQVLAVGGVNTIEDFDVSDAVAVKHPQIWDPDGNGGVGTWTLQSALADQSKVRNYHSTAVLMPDGRVVSASGHINVGDLHEADQYYAEIYCPPYLFKANGTTLATRPTITDAVQFVRYGRSFSVCVSSDTVITQACLIRSPSTTHGFDQSQRYVPLTLVSGIGDASYISVTGPADSSVAPPGDYLLFALNGRGVPAVAKWVRVGSTWSSSDATAPDPIDAGAFEAEFIASNSIIYSWQATGDDGMTGVASQYELRYSTSSITTGNFSSRTSAPNIPAPACPEGVQNYQLTGLQSCTNYYIGIKVGDEKDNRSTLSTYGPVRTSCGGGGGFMAKRVSGGEGDGMNAPTSASATRLSFASTPNGALQSGPHVRLVAEFAKGDSVRWTIHKLGASSDASLAALPATQLAVQTADAQGIWRTRWAFTPESGPLGVRSLAKAGRVVFPEGVELDAVETDPARFSCLGATSSRLGDLTAAAPELTGDDIITLAYSPRSSQGAGDDCFFTVLIPGEGLASNTRGLPAADPATPSPKVFAFMPVRPNPIQSSALLRFSLDAPGAARFEIFDAVGRRVRVLGGEAFGAGEHELTWDGRDSGGARVRPGIYLVRLAAGPHRTERKVALLP